MSVFSNKKEIAEPRDTKFLAVTNPHERDSNIKFYNRSHKYDISKDNSSYTSVTTWCHSHFSRFNSTEVIRNIKNGKNWGPSNKYWGMSDNEIAELWKKTGSEAAKAGTKMHSSIETFMNKGTSVNTTQKDLKENYMQMEDTKEWKQFLSFIDDYPDLKPYRTEWMVYHEDLKIAGSIDMVYENPDGTLAIYDWKRSKEISKSNSFGKYSLNSILSDIYDTNFWHYSLQLNVYRYILESKYNKKVTSLNLVRLHPESSEYELLEVPFMDMYLLKLFEERKKLIK